MSAPGRTRTCTCPLGGDRRVPWTTGAWSRTSVSNRTCPGYESRLSPCSCAVEALPRIELGSDGLQPPSWYHLSGPCSEVYSTTVATRRQSLHDSHHTHSPVAASASRTQPWQSMDTRRSGFFCSALRRALVAFFIAVPLQRAPTRSRTLIPGFVDLCLIRWTMEAWGVAEIRTPRCGSQPHYQAHWNYTMNTQPID
jgi:hypothetical protein